MDIALAGIGPEDTGQTGIDLEGTARRGTAPGKSAPELASGETGKRKTARRHPSSIAAWQSASLSDHYTLSTLVPWTWVVSGSSI